MYAYGEDVYGSFNWKDERQGLSIECLLYNKKAEQSV